MSIENRGRFSEEEALREVSKAEQEAKQENSKRPFLEKLLGKNKKDKVDILRKWEKAEKEEMKKESETAHGEALDEDKKVEDEEKNGAFFNPDRDITMEDWKEMIHELQRLHSKNEIFQFGSLAKGMKLLNPGIEFDVENTWFKDYFKEMEDALAVYIKNNHWDSYASIAQQVKIIDPERKIDTPQQAWDGMKTKLHEFREGEDWIRFSKLAVEMKFLDPKLDPETDLSVTEFNWEEMEEELKRMLSFERPHFDYVFDLITSMKLLNPKWEPKMTDAKLHKMKEWFENNRKNNDKRIASSGLSRWNDFAEQGFDLKVLTASNIEISDKGFEITAPKQKARAEAKGVSSQAINDELHRVFEEEKEKKEALARKEAEKEDRERNLPPQEKERRKNRLEALVKDDEKGNPVEAKLNWLFNFMIKQAEEKKSDPAEIKALRKLNSDHLFIFLSSNRELEKVFLSQVFAKPEEVDGKKIAAAKEKALEHINKKNPSQADLNEALRSFGDDVFENRTLRSQLLAGVATFMLLVRENKTKKDVEDFIKGFDEETSADTEVLSFTISG